MEKHPYGNSLIRDFHLKNDKIAQHKNFQKNLYICTCFLLDQMHIKLPFKNAKRSYFFKNMNAIYKITACT